MSVAVQITIWPRPTHEPSTSCWRGRLDATLHGIQADHAKAFAAAANSGLESALQPSQEELKRAVRLGKITTLFDEIERCTGLIRTPSVEVVAVNVGRCPGNFMGLWRQRHNRGYWVYAYTGLGLIPMDGTLCASVGTKRAWIWRSWMQPDSIRENFANCARGGIFYLSSGPEAGPLIIFLHGWPELSISWRHQLPCLGSLGFRAIAVDMPGYGRSSGYDKHEDYSFELIAQDLISLLDALGAEKAVWVGHDMGSPIAWSIAAHYPEQCLGVVSLCVPYRTVECGIEHLISLVDRDIYPLDTHAAGQWDYMRFYEESFGKAASVLAANPGNLIKAMFTRGDPTAAGKPLASSGVRTAGGWFEGASEAPDVPLDPQVLTQEDHAAYSSALRRSGFFGPGSYYMNHVANAEYTRRSINNGYIDLPALFIRATYDHWCECIKSGFADQMRTYCRNLTSITVDSSHWLAQEKPVEVNAALAHWLATSARVWPALPAVGWERPVLD